ncbi:FCD domain-containing protein [Labrys sp. KB_33_2]|uniref:FCD domain-containing protein n=1 Tax=Labrys sp. KB_33_2 TaxID=3237479 RepID=UPI003F91F3B3
MSDGIANLPEKTLAERAYRILREEIVSGALPPGLKLRIEMLRDRYACGAGPLREALSRLVGDHLVVMIGQRGFVVAQTSVAEAVEIGNMRKMLEAEALSLSIMAGDDAWEERIITTYHRLEQVEKRSTSTEVDLAEWERRNQAFHEALVARCQSVWLLRMRQMIFKHHERYRRMSRMTTARTRDVHLEHKALRDFALDRNVDGAVETMRNHIQRTTDAVIAALTDSSRDGEPIPGTDRRWNRRHS